MDNNIGVGMKLETEQVVTKELTAAAVGSGVIDVFATPMMVALMERAAERAVAAALPEGCVTVGTAVNVEHTAATPVGMKVWATATLTQTDGRKLVFNIEARDEKETIGRGTHERFIVNAEKFTAKVNAKAQG